MSGYGPTGREGRETFYLILVESGVCCRPYARRRLFPLSEHSLSLGALRSLRGPQESSRPSHTCHLTGPGSYTNSGGVMSSKPSPHWGCECWDRAANGNDLGPVSLSTSDLFNWKNNMPTYRDEAKRMEEFLFHLKKKILFLNFKSDLGRCSEFIQYPSHFRSQNGAG